MTNINPSVAVTAQRTEREARSESDELQQGWHGWGSPVGLGAGLLSVGGFFVLIAQGLSILSSIS